jgi:hypothetical protein
MGVVSVADTWKRVTRFVGAQLLPMLDEWDAYETHPAVLRAAAVVVAIAIEGLRAAGRRSDEIAAEFVFGGCWQALWSAVRLTRHVWDVGYRFEECTIAQREHRSAVMVAALELVVTCARCIGGLGTDAAEAWLGDTLFDVLAECANPHDESIRRAAIGAVQSIALLVSGDVAVRRATLKERQTSAARLLTHCADFVVDAALLRVGIPGNEGGFSNPTQWRPLPVAERAAGEAEIAGDEESVSDECTTACRVLRAFLLVSRDGVVEGEAAEVAETGAALQPFITAVMERMTKVVTARVNSETANTAIVLMRDAAIFASLCQRSYDAAVLAGPRPSPFPCPRDGSLPDMANAEYDRQAPLWLQRYHRCLEAALDATLPTVLSAARPGAGREESFLRTRIDALRLAQEVVGALASTVPPRKMESDGEAGELASNDDACWPPQPPVLRLSDNYLPVAYRLYSMLVRVLDATSASTAVSPAALADRLAALVSSSWCAERRRCHEARNAAAGARTTPAASRRRRIRRHRRLRVHLAAPPSADVPPPAHARRCRSTRCAALAALLPAARSGLAARAEQLRRQTRGDERTGRRVAQGEEERTSERRGRRRGTVDAWRNRAAAREGSRSSSGSDCRPVANRCRPTDPARPAFTSRRIGASRGGSFARNRRIIGSCDEIRGARRRGITGVTKRSFCDCSSLLRLPHYN